jgi:hypothetical protein
MEGHELRPEEVKPTRLGNQVLLILAQHKAYRICRTKMFCPVDGCTKRIANVSRLMEYLRLGYGAREEDTQDLVRFFTGTMLPGRLKTHLQRTNGTQARGEWNVEGCHCLGCRHLRAVHNRIERRLQQRPAMRANIEPLGWFWGIFGPIIREKPRATSAEVLGEGQAYQCTVPQCAQICANEKGIKAHFTGYHGALLQKHCTAPRCELI